MVVKIGELTDKTVARTNQYSGHVPMLFVNPTHKNVSSVPHILLNCHLSRNVGSTHLIEPKLSQVEQS